MHSTILWLLICILHLPLAGQQITPVITQVTKTDPDVARQLERIATQRFRDAGALELRLNTFTRSLHQEGYLTASVDSLRVSSDTAYVLFHQGIRFAASFIPFNDSDLAVAIAAGYRPSVTGQPPSLPGKHLAYITTQLTQRGFPLAQVLTDSVVVRHDTLFTPARIDKGHYYLWDTLDLRGDFRINNAVMQKILRIRAGEPYSSALLKDLGRQIAPLPFVKLTRGYSIVLTEDHKARLILVLERQKASGFNGILGFGPDPVNAGKMIFSGDVALKLVNAMALAEEMELKWTGIRGDQQLTIGYRQPYLPWLPFGIVYQFELFRKGELYYTLNQRPGILVRSGPGAYFTAYLLQRQSRVLDRSIFQDITALPPWTDFRNTLFGMEYRLGKIDFASNPGKGFVLTGDIAVGKKQILTAADIPASLTDGLALSARQGIGQATAEVYIPITSRWILRPALRASHFYGSTLHENELFMIGGINTLRGFDERSITASSLLLGSLELRYRFEQESHFKIFVDGGWYEKRLQSSYLRDTPRGFGVGLAIPTPAGILQVSYAYGIQLGNPLDLKSGRLHFGLVSLF
jgi:outer membrane protein assembly factor BamA